MEIRLKERVLQRIFGVLAISRYSKDGLEGPGGVSIPQFDESQLLSRLSRSYKHFIIRLIQGSHGADVACHGIRIHGEGPFSNNRVNLSGS